MALRRDQGPVSITGEPAALLLPTMGGHSKAVAIRSGKRALARARLCQRSDLEPPASELSAAAALPWCSATAAGVDASLLQGLRAHGPCQWTGLLAAVSCHKCQFWKCAVWVTPGRDEG